MKKLISVLVLATAFSACKSSNGPEAGGSAIMPKAGSEYTYSVVAPAGTLQETATITYAANDSFTVARVSDTVNGFHTTAIEHYVVRSTGDLFLVNSECDCDTLALPIASHREYTSAGDGIVTPTKENGYVDPNSTVIFETGYEGDGTIPAAGSIFDCAQVHETITVRVASGKANGGEDTTCATHSYWYSPSIAFFVQDLETNRANDRDSTIFTRTLVSYQLAK